MTDFFEFEEYQLRTETDTVGAATYIGYNRDQDASTSASSWLIKRVTVSGTVGQTLYASQAFDQVWDDRVTLFGTPPFSNTRSVIFDGTNDYVNFGNLSALSFDRLDPWSWSGWFRTNSTAEQAILGKQGGTNTTGYRITQQSNQLRFHFSGGAGANRIEVRSPSLGLADDSWHFGAVAYDGSSNASGVTMLIDDVYYNTGALTQQTDNLTSTTVSTDVFQISGRNLTAQEWNGFLDSQALFSLGLSEAQMRLLLNEAAGTATPGDISQLAFYAADCQMWCRMGENSTFPTLTDLSPNGASGTMTNMTASDIVGETASVTL